ncbi:hypothetical protein Y602_5981 [Burkholderia pseudomallei MSHR733]|nr:hypothetical protein Y602_5981 [Burkholderia pseudomallei MSHR733]
MCFRLHIPEFVPLHVIGVFVFNRRFFIDLHAGAADVALSRIDRCVRLPRARAALVHAFAEKRLKTRGFLRRKACAPVRRARSAAVTESFGYLRDALDEPRKIPGRRAETIHA